MATVRRTQVQRSATTRAALLDATIDCVVEHGYANTTTGLVAQRAGLSRGAHLHHFQTRAALVGAAMEHLAARRTAELHAQADTLPDAGPERTAAALDLFFSAYCGPLFRATLDLWAAARADDELRAALTPIERHTDRETMRLARHLFAAHVDEPDFAERVDLALNTIRGLAVLAALDPNGKRVREQWAFARPWLIALFEG
ncbi:MAG: TetR family transcriptional regulator [Solirubrobacteraceae bacterium]|nr:TetR family transcriptional regulator [Solirubrobacteraceae bacterium]